MTKRDDITEEVKDGVVRDYLRGDKAIVIQMEYKISPGVIYRILHRKGVGLRRDRVAVPLSLRPKCRRCDREYDPGLRKDGQPDRRETMCWICCGWATEFRGSREVYNQDGSKVMSREDDPWERRP